MIICSTLLILAGWISAILLISKPNLVAGFLPSYGNLPTTYRNICRRHSYVENRSDIDIEYATINVKDIPKLAKMISTNFDGPFSWWQKLSEIYSVWTLECQLSDRIEKFVVNNERQHLMLVARVDGEAVGLFSSLPSFTFKRL